MIDYEYMKQVVVITAFAAIMLWDAYVVVYWVVKGAKWLWKKVRK